MSYASYTVGSHQVMLHGCASNSLIQAGGVTINGKQTSEPESRVSCDNLNLVIKGDSLAVNGKSYGNLQENDSITVKDGTVWVNNDIRKAEK